jgi:hypothetical protein
MLSRNVFPHPPPDLADCRAVAHPLFRRANTLFGDQNTLECTPKVRQINKEHFFWEGKCPLASDVYSAGSSSSRR